MDVTKEPWFESVVELSEGNPGAINVMMNVITNYPLDVSLRFLLGLDELGIRGRQIFGACKYVCKEDFDLFITRVRERDKTLADEIAAARWS